MTAAAITLALLLAIPASGDDGVDELLRRHFMAKTQAERLSVQKEILAVKELTPAKLAAAIKALQLWTPQQTGEYEVSTRLRKGESSGMQVWMQVPAAYDPAKAWPLVIALHGHAGKADQMLRLTKELLGSRAERFIIAAPQDLGPLGLTMPADVVARPRNVLNALRRVYHIDSDRVFIIGYSQGSHDAWMAAIMHPDCFAGIVPLATHLQLVGDDLLYEELLPNARNIAILFCWGKLDTLDVEGKPHPKGGNAAFCRKMTAVINSLAFEHFKSVEFDDVGHLGVAPPEDLLADVLHSKRTHYPKHVRQAFRLPDQSDAYWIGAEGIEGEPLSDGTLSIPVAPDEDPVAAKRKWLISKLGLIEAECKGQAIKLTARRTPSVFLLLSDELLDLDKPVKIMRGKKKLFEGMIERDMGVMLTEAAKGWDFSRLPVARVVVPRGGKVKIGYPRADKQPKKNQPDKKDRVK